jgi:hypothetical protein
MFSLKPHSPGMRMTIELHTLLTSRTYNHVCLQYTHTGLYDSTKTSLLWRERMINFPRSTLQYFI